MRNEKARTRIFLCMICLSLLVTMIGSLRYLYLYAGKNSENVSALEHVIGTMHASIGYQYGGIYSITGERIASEQEVTVDESQRTIYAANDGYSSVIGSENGLMIYDLKNLLLSADSESNRLDRTGNSIITTLHPAGQAVANECLSRYGKDVQASITVVLRDGAVLVDTGNNTYSASAIADPEAHPGLYLNYNIINIKKGSSFKSVAIAMLINHNEELDPEFSIWNSEFEDVSYIEIPNGSIIHNADYQTPGAYVTNQNGLYTRPVDLSAALRHSSNTYIVRHVQNLGFSKSYRYMNELYGLNKDIITDTNTISGLDIADERLPWFFFGQDAEISAIRLCHLYNFIFSGEFYKPFYVASVFQPDGSMIYKATPTPSSNYSLDPKDNDILKNALCDCFEAYAGDKLSRYGDVIWSRRILCKSGTAETETVDAYGHKMKAENRTMMMTVFSQDGAEVLASACVCVNNTTTSISNATLCEMLLNTVQAIGLI